jgi:hypothetical protein
MGHMGNPNPAQGGPKMNLQGLKLVGVFFGAILGFSSLWEAPNGLSEPLSITSTTVWIDNGYDESPAPPPTTIPLVVANCDDAVNMARAIGFPETELETLRRVMERESGPTCAPTAFNAADPNGGSYGLTQINGFWCEPSPSWPMGWLQIQNVGVNECADLFDPVIALRSTRAIFFNSGWHPWRATK